MTNAKNTKRALVSSLLALVLCVSMLIGSTYAWFTDTATTGVNTIQSGTLEIDLVDAAGNSLQNETLDFKKATGAESETLLWEPGCTYELEDVYVKNLGNLALKYKVVINGLEGDAELLDVITWTIKVNGTEYDNLSAFEGHLTAGQQSSGTITISGHMDEDAGNTYQNKTLSGISITVYATQDTVEHDSYNNTYDANAEYDGYTAPVPTADLTYSDGQIVVATVDGGTAVMDGIYTFTAKDDYHSAEASGYGDWLCDYYISFDKDVAAGAGAIGGSYANWEDGKWLVLSPEQDLPANTEIALLETLEKGLNLGGETTWTYSTVCLLVEQFNCGVVAEHEDSMNGTTMTVELRMTNPDDGTVKVIEHIEYTFE